MEVEGDMFRVQYGAEPGYGGLQYAISRLLLGL
jgi:hypothetical protein